MYFFHIIFDKSLLQMREMAAFMTIMIVPPSTISIDAGIELFIILIAIKFSLH